MLSAAKNPRALSFRPPWRGFFAALILPLTVVDNSDLRFTRFFGDSKHSDEPIN